MYILNAVKVWLHSDVRVQSFVSFMYLNYLTILTEITIKPAIRHVLSDSSVGAWDSLNEQCPRLMKTVSSATRLSQKEILITIVHLLLSNFTQEKKMSYCEMTPRFFNILCDKYKKNLIRCRNRNFQRLSSLKGQTSVIPCSVNSLQVMYTWHYKRTSLGTLHFKMDILFVQGLILGILYF